MKVKCVGYKEKEQYFTIGKVYEVINGKITNDNGYTYQTMTIGDNPDEWQLSGWYTFEKVTDDNWKVVIIPDGDKTVAKLYENNTVVKTAEVKRYHRDEYDSAVAIREVTKKLVGESAEDSENTDAPKHKFQAGDLVEVVADDENIVTIGLRGYIVGYEDFNDVALVDFKIEYPFTHCGYGTCEISTCTARWMRDDELKLIKRADEMAVQ